MMTSPLEICELVEQLTWPYRISICLVHSRKSYLVRNVMAVKGKWRGQRKCAKLAPTSRQTFLCSRHK